MTGGTALSNEHTIQVHLYNCNASDVPIGAINALPLEAKGMAKGMLRINSERPYGTKQAAVNLIQRHSTGIDRKFLLIPVVSDGLRQLTITGFAISNATARNSLGHILTCCELQVKKHSIRFMT